MENFLSQNWEDQLEEFLTQGPGNAKLRDLIDSQSSSFLIDALQLTDLFKVFPVILLDPERQLEKCHEILRKCACAVSGEDLGLRKLFFRITSMPNYEEFIRHTIPKSEDVGSFLSIKGTVIKSSTPKMLEYRKEFQCSKCRYTFESNANYDTFYQFERPTSCPNPEGCAGFNLNPIGEMLSSNCKDFQEIKVQEQVGNLTLGTIPRSIWVTLEDDLVDKCKPGDDVVVIGTVKRRWHNLGRSTDGRTEIELVIKANYVQVQNDQKSTNLVTEEQVEEYEQFWDEYEFRRLEGRDRILASFCPQVFGLYAIKLAVSVILCGGVERVDPSGTRVRGEPHMLLVGDPGTGKSQILKYAAKISPRSVMTTGIGSTSAGLTVSAVKDSGEWHLEAGALVLADGGVCCIDEFNTIKEADRTCIHEAMEQQSISVAKAGLVCKLQTRCSVLAATNPKGKYDPEQPLTINIAVASPLLSRFDLVFTLLDSRNEQWDRVVSSYILEGKDPYTCLRGSGSPPWPFEKLRSYFLFVKKSDPALTEEASVILGKYYQRQRGSDGVNMARTTVRLLQSCIRLAQGHARLVHHSSVEIMDAVFAVVLLEASTVSSASLMAGVNPLHTTFPEDPVQEYKTQAERILIGLGLNELWIREKARLDEDSQRSTGVSKPSVPHSEGAVVESPEKKLKNKFMSQVISKIRENKVCFVEEPARKRRKRRKKINEAEKEEKREETDDDDFERVEEEAEVIETHEVEEAETVETHEDVENNETVEADESIVESKSEEKMDDSTESNKSISEKTMSKLQKFKAPEEESFTSVKPRIRTVDSSLDDLDADLDFIEASANPNPSASASSNASVATAPPLINKPLTRNEKLRAVFSKAKSMQKSQGAHALSMREVNLASCDNIFSQNEEDDLSDLQL